jgi:hypothetical protein
MKAFDEMQHPDLARPSVNGRDAIERLQFDGSLGAC